MASNAVKTTKVEFALIDDAKSVDVNFNKYANMAQNSASQAFSAIEGALKNLTLAMAEVEKAQKVYKEIEKSATALGIKPTDIGYTILVNEVMMDASRYEELLSGLQDAKKALGSTGFF
jgi:exosome complex RNA-binding protein Rrp42 (RNase PH superfamily)